MQPETVLFALVVLVIAGVVAYLNRRAAQRRRAEFAAFAAQLGLTYAEQDDSLPGHWHGEPFGSGDHRRAKNVLTGSFEGHRVVAFDYSYQTHSSTAKGGRRTTTHHFGVVVRQLPGPLPHLQVTHEGIFGGAVANALGFADLEFESERFNRAFRVKAADARFGHAVVHPRLMETLLARGEIGWRFEGDSLVGWDGGPHTPGEVLRRLRLLSEVAGHVPPYVWRDYAGVDPRGN